MYMKIIFYLNFLKFNYNINNCYSIHEYFSILVSIIILFPLLYYTYFVRNKKQISKHIHDLIKIIFLILFICIYIYVSCKSTSNSNSLQMHLYFNGYLFIRAKFFKITSAIYIVFKKLLIMVLKLLFWNLIGTIIFFLVTGIYYNKFLPGFILWNNYSLREFTIIVKFAIKEYFFGNWSLQQWLASLIVLFFLYLLLSLVYNRIAVILKAQQSKFIFKPLTNKQRFFLFCLDITLNFTLGIICFIPEVIHTYTDLTINFHKCPIYLSPLILFSEFLFITIYHNFNKYVLCYCKKLFMKYVNIYLKP